MSAYKGSISGEDIGELIELIRVKHLRMNDATFAHKLGISPELLMNVEDGKGPHGFNVLKKIKKNFPEVEISVIVKLP